MLVENIVHLPVTMRRLQPAFLQIQYYFPRENPNVRKAIVGYTSLPMHFRPDSVLILLLHWSIKFSGVTPGLYPFENRIRPSVPGSEVRDFQRRPKRFGCSLPIKAPVWL
ncbi:hypothetical protein DR999_PMT02885 [Platysternon megacephalum]|uniref:Uncharacterized protein n=1 Tax=Platysternon megacephalum TaxID=55544 RepID=A0A4D9ER16_9SAUR|nr:hypothetical protein DR999_PMT02885 [Platysternon megacephalum]